MQSFKAVSTQEVGSCLGEMRKSALLSNAAAFVAPSHVAVWLRCGMQADRQTGRTDGHRWRFHDKEAEMMKGDRIG